MPGELIQLNIKLETYKSVYFRATCMRVKWDDLKLVALFVVLRQVRSLEKSLGQVVGDFEMERQRWEARRREEAAQTKVESDGLRRLIALKTKELKNIRKLAQVSGRKSDPEMECGRGLVMCSSASLLNQRECTIL